MSTLLFRPPNPAKSRHEFKLGDTVRIARLCDTFTSRDIIGHIGTIVEQDDEWPFAYMCDVACSTCRSIHTMNEDELDLHEGKVVEAMREKAGVEMEPSTVDPAAVMIDSILATEMLLAGFTRTSVAIEKPMLSDVADQGWRRTLLFMVRLATIAEIYQAVQRIAVAANSKVLSVETYSAREGWAFVRAGDEEVTCLEIPIRVVLVERK
jgi:hypothetical protein